MTPTGETIHSHPIGSFLRLNQTDRNLAWVTHAAEPGARTFLASPHGFSETDYASGPGYLVTAAQLLYQNAPKQAMVIGPVL